MRKLFHGLEVLVGRLDLAGSFETPYDLHRKVHEDEVEVVLTTCFLCVGFVHFEACESFGAANYLEVQDEF